MIEILIDLFLNELELNGFWLFSKSTFVCNEETVRRTDSDLKL
jgi:hypothetical protein